MNDKLRKAMMRPDCIMGVTPDNGGSWLSPIAADGPQPTTLPAASDKPWAIGSGMLNPLGGMVIDDAFEFPANNTDVKCGTALDMRGSTESFTFFCEFEIDAPTAEQTHHWYPMLMAQGYPPAGSFTCTPASMYLRRNKGATQWSLFGYINVDTSTPGINGNIDLTYNERHTAAFVRDIENLQLVAYFDGVQFVPKSNAAVATAITTATSATFKPELGVCIGAGLVGGNTCHEMNYRIYSAAVFNRALSAEEIADLS